MLSKPILIIAEPSNMMDRSVTFSRIFGIQSAAVIEPAPEAAVEPSVEPLVEPSVEPVAEPEMESASEEEDGETE